MVELDKDTDSEAVKPQQGRLQLCSVLKNRPQYVYLQSFEKSL